MGDLALSPSALRWGGFAGLVLTLTLLVFGPSLAAAQFPELCLRQAQRQWPGVSLVPGTYQQTRDTAMFVVRSPETAVGMPLVCRVVSPRSSVRGLIVRVERK